MDKLLIFIAKNKLNKFNNKKINTLITKIKKYAKIQVKRKTFDSKGIYEFLNYMYKSSFKKLLDNCYSEIEAYIEEIFLTDLKKENVILLFKLYFMLEKSRYYNSLLYKTNGFLKNDKFKLNVKERLEILFMASVVGEDTTFFECEYFESDNIFKTNRPECELYTKYYDELESDKSYEKSKRVLGEIMKSCEEIDPKILDKFWLHILGKIRESKNLKNEKKSERIKEVTDIKNVDIKMNNEIKHSGSSMGVNLENENLTVISSLIMISNGDGKCPLNSIHNNKLQTTKVYIAYFGKGKQRALTGIKKVSDLYCSGCGKYFVNKSLLDQITKNVSLTMLKVSNIIGDSKISPYSQEVLDFKKLQSKLNSNINEVGLNKKSKLGELGYSVSLSRNERWRKIEIAISQLGLKEVIKHITWLLRMRRANTSFDNSYALTEWEYDLRRIEKEYMKS